VPASATPSPSPSAPPTLTPPAPLNPAPSLVATGSTAEPSHPDPPSTRTPKASLPHAAQPKPGELIARAQRAAQRGRLTAPTGECAVDQLVAAREAGATSAALRKPETHALKVLEVQARRDMKRRAFGEARDSYAGILKLRPEDRAAAAGLREAEHKLKR